MAIAPHSAEMRKTAIGIARVILLLLLIIAAKYLNNSLLSNIISLSITLAVFIMFDDLFWVIFVFIYASNPAGLFSQYTFGLDIGPVVIDFSQLVIIALIFRVSNKKPVFRQFYRTFLLILLLMTFINFINGVAAGFSEFRILMRIFKLILPLSFIFIFPRVIKQDSDFRYFFGILFPFVLISFAAQVLVYPLGVPPAVMLFGWELQGAESGPGEVAVNEDLSRYVFSVFLQAASLIGCMYYLNLKERTFNRYYLGLVMFICFFSVLLSGTRSWTVGFGIVIILWSLLSLKRVRRFIIPGISVILISILIIQSFPVLRQQLSLAINRISTVELFVEGDVTAGETSSRFDVRGPQVMKAFRETNQIIGAGFSEYYFEHADGHVGHQTLLLQSGYLGYFLLNTFILFLIFRQLNLYFRSKPTKSQEALSASALLLLGLYVVFPGLAIFSYIASPETGTFYGFYLAFAGFYSYKLRIENAGFREPVVLPRSRFKGKSISNRS